MNKDRMIRVYGTLRNWTVNKDIADFNPTREGCIRVRTSEKDGSGHDDAIALAYQLYDNRFRECDGNLKPWERFQDIINKRVTNIKFVSKAHCHEWADEEAYTEIDGPIAIQYTDEDGNVDPENWKNGADTEPVILQEILKWFKEKIEKIEGDIININNKIQQILNDITSIINRIIALENRKVVTDVTYDSTTNKLKVEYTTGDPSYITLDIPEPVTPTGESLWEINPNDNSGIRPKNNKKVYGPGFYDTEVQNP